MFANMFIATRHLQLCDCVVGEHTMCGASIDGKATDMCCLFFISMGRDEGVRNNVVCLRVLAHVLVFAFSIAGIAFVFATSRRCTILSKQSVS